ncbi:MAG: oligosaccharide flippase family protein [Deltaproteobacteria bacterium]|nr:oligosaccharide flippase family protein [Desulfitobacteriaceae bacterium]MDI6855025.1 oligosaccharide flippase family protein [Deltaproteobacteria bacterium]
MNDKKEIVRVFSTKIFYSGMGLITGIIVARILGPEGKGEYTMALLLASMTVSLGSLNIGESAIYFLNRRRADLGTILCTDGVFIIFSSTAYIFILLLLWKFGFLPWGELNQKNILFFVCLYIPVIFLQIHNVDLLRATRQFSLYNLILVIQPLTYLLFLLFLVVHWEKGVAGALAAGLGAYFLTALIGWGSLVRFPKVMFRWDGAYLKDLLFYSIKGHLGNIAQKFNLRLDQFFISPWWGAAALGQYSVAVVLTELIWYVPDSIGIITLPRLASFNRTEAALLTVRCLKVTALLTLFLAFSMAILVRPAILLLYGSPFEPAVYAVWLLLPGIVAMGFSKILSKYFSGIGRPEINSATSLVSVIITVILCPPLISRFGFLGAAVASSSAYTIRMLLDVVLFLRSTHLSPAVLVAIRLEEWRDIMAMLPFVKSSR